MDQTYSYEVVVKNSALAVIVPLNDCICSLNRVYEALIAADVHAITGHCSNYDYTRQQIVQAWWSLQLSDQAATACLRCLDESLETFIQDEGTLKCLKNATKHTLDNLRTKKASNEKLLKVSLGALVQANTNLRSTIDILESQERRVQNARMLTGVGLGVSLIPFVGWVVGPALVISGAAQMAKASRGITIAEEEMRTFKNQVDNYADKVWHHMTKILQAKLDIGAIDHRLMKIGKDIHMMRMLRQFLAELQRKMRSAVHLLGVLSGKVNVLEQQTRRFILQVSVMKMMEEVMKSMEEVAGNELLQNKDMLRLVDQMRKNSHLLRTICASQNADEIDSFLLKYI